MTPRMEFAELLDIFGSEDLDYTLRSLALHSAHDAMGMALPE